MQRIPGARWLARLAKSGTRSHVRNPVSTEKVEDDWQGCLMPHISTHMWTFMPMCIHTTHAQQKEKWNQVRPLGSEQAIRVLLATHLWVGIFMDYCQSRAAWKAHLALVCVLCLSCDTRQHLRTRSPHQQAGCHPCIPSSIGFPVSRL